MTLKLKPLVFVLLAMVASGCFPEKDPSSEPVDVFPLSPALTAYLADHPDAFSADRLRISILPDGTIPKKGNALSSLEKITIRDPENKYGISTLDDLLSYLSSLEILHIEGTGITRLPLGTQKKLVSLVCRNARSLSSVDVSLCPALDTLVVSGGNLEGIGLENLPLLRKIDLSRNRLLSLDISRCQELLWLDVSGQDVPECTLILYHGQAPRSCVTDSRIRRRYLDIRSVSTDMVNRVTDAGATVWGSVLDSLPGISERGIVYSDKTDDPYVDDGVTVVAQEQRTRFVSVLASLKAGTRYYARSYLKCKGDADRQDRTYYGEVLSFVTGGGDPVPSPSGSFITFADPETRRICLDSWDADGNGELSYAEAAAVKDIGTVFRGSEIRSFEEFSCFTGVEALPELAFAQCVSLQRICFPSGMVRMGADAFRGCTSLKHLPLPPVQKVGDGAFASCTGLETVSFSDETEEIGADAFRGCRSLVSVSFPRGLTRIGPSAFRECVNLRELRFASTALEQIADQAFCGCYSLVSVGFPGTFRTLGEAAFEDCTYLRTLQFPEGMTELESTPFPNCSFERVTFPSTMRRIGNLAFQRCAKLEVLQVKAPTPPEVTGYVEEQDDAPMSIPTGIKKIIVPGNSMFAYMNAPAWLYYLDFLTSK